MGMRTHTLLIVSVTIAGLTAMPALAAEVAAPQGVSPGSPVAAERLGASCPTFSWTTVADVESYELVVYRIVDTGELVAVMEHRLPAGAVAWTPPAELCPASGERYAWGVRAVIEGKAGAWSELMLFETAGKPSDDDVRHALEVLRRYRQASSETETRVTAGPALADSPTAVSALDLGAGALTSVTVGASPTPQTVTPPASFALDLDGDLRLGGAVFSATGTLSYVFIHHPLTNTAVGLNALAEVSPDVPGGLGLTNTAFGHQAQRNTTEGSDNTAVGYQALRANTAGSGNTAIGSDAMGGSSGANGNQNTAVGWYAGANWTTGDSNIAIGHGAEGGSSDDGVIRIGGANNQTQTHIEGIFNGDFPALIDPVELCVGINDQLAPCSTSSARFKQDVRTLGNMHEALSTLRPVSFRYRKDVVADRAAPVQYGFLAEEVAEVLPTLVTHDEEGRPYTVRYALLTPLLLAEIQRQERELEALRERVERLSRRKRLRER